MYSTSLHFFGGFKWMQMGFQILGFPWKFQDSAFLIVDRCWINSVITLSQDKGPHLIHVALTLD